MNLFLRMEKVEHTQMGEGKGEEVGKVRVGRMNSQQHVEVNETAALRQKGRRRVKGDGMLRTMMMMMMIG